MELTCKISNINSESYDVIMLRKFFQILFISSDFKSFDIYTAIVIGKGYKDSPGELNLGGLNDDFSIEVTFSCADIDSKATIVHKDLTNSFLDQISCVRGVWGNESRIIGDQKDFSNCLKEIYGNTITVDNNKTNIKNSNKPIYILDKSRADMAKSHTSIAFKGNCKIQVGNDTAPFILSPGGKLHGGVEIINWIKSTITLDKPIDEQSQFNYAIELEPKMSQYFTPDFTFYISPPPNCIVDVDTAEVRKVNKSAENDEDAKSVQLNLIQSVAKSSPLYYKEWKKDHHIESRKMSRIIPKSMISRIEEPAPYHKLVMKFVLKNPSKQPVAFFILGILLSALLAFGSDSARLMALSKYFPFNKWLQPDILWIINCVTLFIVFFIKNIRLNDTKEVVRMRVCRNFSAIAFMLWAFYLFVFLRMNITFMIPSNPLFIINTVLALLVLLSNILYSFLAIFDKSIASQYPIGGIFSKIWS